MNHNTSAQCHTENGEVFMTDQSGNGHHLKQRTMKKLSEIYKELGIAFSFPIEITNANGYDTYYETSDNYWARYERDAKGKETYFENSDNYWYRYEYDAKGKETYFENSDDYWQKWERDVKGRPTYHEDSNGFWQKWERDADGNMDYYEDSTGVKKGTPKASIILDEEESIRFAEMLKAAPRKPTPAMQRAIQAYRDSGIEWEHFPEEPYRDSFINNQ